MSKPTIYGFCPAGCKYPVASKDDFDNVASQVTEMRTGKVGDTIIPRKKLLWSGEITANSDDGATATLSEAVADGDIIEILVGALTTDYYKFIADSVGKDGNVTGRFSVPYGQDNLVAVYQVNLYFPTTTTFKIDRCRIYKSTGAASASSARLYKVYKIIE